MTHDTQTFTFDAAPTIVIQTCNGDLKVTGQVMEERQVAVVTDDATRTVQGGDQLVIGQCDDARFTVPRDATLVVQRVDGDVRVERVATLQIESVGGGLDAHEVEGACALNRVDGDVRVADIAVLALGDVGGDLRLEGAAEGMGRADKDMELALGHIHGDAQLDGLRGRLRLTRVDGDATLRGAVDGFGPTYIGDDLTSTCATRPATSTNSPPKGTPRSRWRRTPTSRSRRRCTVMSPVWNRNSARLIAPALCGQPGALGRRGSRYRSAVTFAYAQRPRRLIRSHPCPQSRRSVQRHPRRQPARPPHPPMPHRRHPPAPNWERRLRHPKPAAPIRRSPSLKPSRAANSARRKRTTFYHRHLADSDVAGLRLPPQRGPRWQTTPTAVGWSADQSKPCLLFLHEQRKERTHGCGPWTYARTATSHLRPATGGNKYRGSARARGTPAGRPLGAGRALLQSGAPASRCRKRSVALGVQPSASIDPC